MKKRLIISVTLVVGFVAALLAPLAAAATSSVVESGLDRSPAVRSAFAAPAQPGQPTTRVLPAALPPNYPFWNLQLNVCNSGFVARCYTGGQAIPEAQQVMRNVWPDVVTVNEACLPDIRDHLFQTMAQLWPGDWVFWAFMPAWNRSQNAPYQCKDGRGEFGNAVLGHVPAANWAGADAWGGIHQWQEAETNEWRSWVCARAITNYYACTTHLATNGSAAFLQCQDLHFALVPSLWSRNGYLPTVVGGDFNLKFGGSPDIQGCVPSGWYRKGDGDVQHWFLRNEFRFDFSQAIDMTKTDHPAWLVATIKS